jgi:glutathione S-transferase
LPQACTDDTSIARRLSELATTATGVAFVTLLQIYALTAVVLAFKMAAISVVQGLARTRAKKFLNPEDARTLGGEAVPVEVETVQRAARAWRNDLENIPIFLILAWVYVAAGLSATTFLIYCTVFVIARIVHTICYLNSVQPLRTISYTIGAIAQVALMINLVIRVIFA